MVSVAIKCENCSNIQIIGGSVKGFYIGYLFENVRSVNINGGKLNVNNRGIVGNKMIDAKVENLEINQNFIQTIPTLNDLIKFLIYKTRLDNHKILAIYKELNESLNTPVFI